MSSRLQSSLFIERWGVCVSFCITDPKFRLEYWDIWYNTISRTPLPKKLTPFQNLDIWYKTIPPPSPKSEHYRWFAATVTELKNILFTTNPLNMGSLNPKESPLSLITSPLDPIFASRFRIFWHSFFRWWTHGRQAWIIKIIFQDFNITYPNRETWLVSGCS